MFSKRHPRARSWAYFLSTDLARSVVETLRGYGGRWSCEVVNFYTKTHLGLADFRVRSFEAVDRYVVVVHLAWAYVEKRFVQERSAQIQCYGDLIRRHREEHALRLVDSRITGGAGHGPVGADPATLLARTGVSRASFPPPRKECRKTSWGTPRASCAPSAVTSS